MIEALWCEKAFRPRRSVPVDANPIGFEVRGRHFLYDPNDLRLFHCDSEAQKKTLNSERGFITEKPQFDLPSVKARMLVVVLTHACNLRCAYCFHGKSLSDIPKADEPVVMDPKTVRRALEYISPGADFTLGFFGGEPLLYPERIKEIAAEAALVARHRQVRIRFSLTTNGTLLDPGMAEYLAEMGFSLIVSLDGSQPLHDAARPMASGRGSYLDTLEGIEAIADHPGLATRTTLRGTYTGGNAHLVKRLEHLNEIREEYGLGNISVEPADLSEGCAGGGSLPVTIDPSLREEYYDAAEWFVAKLRAGHQPRFHHLSVRIDRFLKRAAQPSECGAGCGYLTVNPLGKLYACHREGESCIGDIENGVDTELQAVWRDNRYYAREKCPECWLRNLCGGGCRLNSLHQCQNIYRPDPLGCDLAEVCSKAAAWILSELTDAERGNLLQR